MNLSKTVLELKNVSKYFGKSKVIDNINIEVEEGEIFGFLGPNGAGKTTTIKMILGLLSIDGGWIRINGYDVKREFEQARESIGGIVENPDMYGYMSGWDNLKLHAKMRQVDTKRIDEVVKMVGLEHKIKDKVSKYSLGMKQRLGLALTLLHSPKVLILDEPTNGLDPAGIKDFRNILKEISQKNHIAVFISSHILSEMQAMCKRIAVLDKGKVIDIENMYEVLQQTEQEILNYRLEVKEQERAIAILKKDFNLTKKVEHNEIVLAVSKEQMAKIIDKLAKEEISIYSAYAKQKSLEDTFFHVTKKEESHE